jgi:arylsulfatase A-like enzyme
VPAPRDPTDVRRERAVYFALVEHLDDQVGRILKALEEAGELERTLVIFTSDHGLALGSHGLMGKQNQYEHTIDVPLIMAGPGVPRGKRLPAQCYLRDLFPTVSDLAGVPVPAGLDGRSLRPVLAGERDRVHDAVFGYFTDAQRMMRTDDGWKVVWYPKAGRTQLFHVAADPDELRDLAAESAHGHRLREMTGALGAWLRRRGDPAAQAH